MSTPDLPVILHNDKRGLLTIEDGRLDVLQLSHDGRPPKRLLSSSARNLLLVKLAGPVHDHHEQRRLDIHTLIAKGSELRLSKMHVLVEPADAPDAESWAKTAMKAAYGDVKPYRRILLMINPVGGKGKAKALVRDQALPVLEAAGCKLEVQETTHAKHAEEIARDMSLDYDIIATASGDGLVNEVLNGLASRPDARKALNIPVAPIPTGSANALCSNLFGVKDTFNIPLACLNIIKGSPLPLDLASVLLLPSKTVKWSFLAVALGLMVDLDIGTEYMRWLGDTRFVIGFLKGIVESKNFKCRIKMKVVESDKIEMARKARERVSALEDIARGVDLPSAETGHSSEYFTPHESPAAGSAAGSKVALARPSNGKASNAELEGFITPDPLQPDDSWMMVETSHKKPVMPQLKYTPDGSGYADSEWQHGQGMLYFYAGMMPWASRDLMQWPVATGGEGLIDVVIQSVVPRTTLVNAITGAEKGDAYWMTCQHYYKVSAFTAENLDPDNQKLFTIDGEAYPFEEYHVQVHSGLASTLSLEGHFFISDFLHKHHLKE